VVRLCDDDVGGCEHEPITDGQLAVRGRGVEGWRVRNLFTRHSHSKLTRVLACARRDHRTRTQAYLQSKEGSNSTWQPFGETTDMGRLADVRRRRRLDGECMWGACPLGH